MNIESQHVTYEIALNLKKKGFNVPCYSFYNGDEIQRTPYQWNHNLHEGIYESDVPGTKVGTITKGSPIQLSAPEIWQVVEWLRAKREIWIYTYPVEPFSDLEDNYPRIVWMSKVCSLSQLRFEKFIVDADNELLINHHRSPQDAYMAAINYLLTL